MSGSSGDDSQAPQAPTPEAQSRPIRFSLIWLIPIVVLAIGAYLGWTTISRQGPEITIQFDSADGITVGQTQVKHKAVGLGTVQGLELSRDLQHVEVRVQMSAQARPLLTDHAKFWVVRARLSGASVSGLETLISGAFIAIDPGAPGGTAQTDFKGLDAPPGVRSDEPGSTFTLHTGTLGAITEGSPVFFRDVTVGEVLGYRMPPDGHGPIPVQIFIRAPYDKFVRQDTRFWDVSGISVGFDNGGLRVQLESLQALITGGVAFGLPQRQRAKNVPSAAPNSSFTLFSSQEAADSASYHERYHVVTYLKSSVAGLAVGNPVDMFGVQVGSVSGVKLIIGRDGEARVRVEMEVQPERVLSEDQVKKQSFFQVTQALVDHGMRATTDSASLITGATIISFTFVPNAPPVKLTMEGDAVVVPGQGGGLSGITDALSQASAKLAALPIQQIGDNLNNLLAHADATVASPELTQSLVELHSTLANLSRLSNEASRGLQPFLQRLPQISDELQQAVTNANAALQSYGGNSDFHADLQQTLDQLNETARSVRSLVDFLKRHPSSLIFGRSQP